MSSPGRILVLGYNAWDVNLSVDGFPPLDSKVAVDDIRVGGGGPGATAAVALARLGARVRLVTRFGDDLPGEFQQCELRAAGVDISASEVVAGHRSPLAVIMVHPQTGQRTIFWSRGDLPPLPPEAAVTGWLDDADLFYTDGHENAAALVLAAEARRRGIPVVMDAGSVRPGAAELVAEVSDLISSEVFAPALTGCPAAPAALRAVRLRGPRHVAMTFGAGGVLGLVDDQVCHVPAFAVPVVDTTGAGDAFHAGYALARSAGRDFAACLEYGCAVAALKCTDYGGRRGLPDAAAVAELLATGSRLPIPAHLAAWLG